MIPINSRTLKQQEDSRGKFIKETQIRLQQLPISDYCSHLMEGFMIKNHLDVHQSHNYLGVPADEYFYDPNLSLKNSWYLSNNNCYEDFYNCRIKREEDDDQKLWPAAQIKDQESISANHENGFQTCQFPKQEEFQYMSRISFQDPNKFLSPYLAPTKEEKNIRRKLKVQAYLKKKSMRSFEKKIIYKCRKQVADNRIRYRGRFISIHQAATILKLDPKQNHNPAELMQKLKTCNNMQWHKQQKEGKKSQQSEPKTNKIQEEQIENERPMEAIEQEKLQKLQQNH